MPMASAARMAWRICGVFQLQTEKKGAHDQAVGLTNICQLARTMARLGICSPRAVRERRRISSLM